MLWDLYQYKVVIRKKGISLLVFHSPGKLKGRERDQLEDLEVDGRIY
jgi:hypothetical protein